MAIFRVGLNRRPSPPAASSRACLSSISLCRHLLLSLGFLTISESRSSRLRPCVLSLYRFGNCFFSLDGARVELSCSCSLYINGSVTGASYLTLGLGLGRRNGSGASTRTTCGPLSRAGSGFSKIGPAGSIGSGSRSCGSSVICSSMGGGSSAATAAAVSCSLCSASIVAAGLAAVLVRLTRGFTCLAFGAFVFFAGGFRFTFFLIRTLSRSTFLDVSTVVIFSPSLNHSRIVAVRPADITDIWFFTSRPSSWHFLTIAALFTPSSLAKM
ncbi:hypothetical protein ES703_98056 [subsurface metagenome]